jgi:hypothetical protein
LSTDNEHDRHCRLLAVSPHPVAAPTDDNYDRCMIRFRAVSVATLLLASSAYADAKPFVIQVVDDETGRGVPLVELQTVNNIRLVTDSHGIVAFDEPGLFDQRVFFSVKSHGYEFAKDAFGFRGQALEVKAGEKATLKIKRLNISQRLYRVTGAGIYRDSVLAGENVPLREPVLNGQVFGSDSVVNAVYRGKIHWFWGDTNRPSYPLGNFHVPGAVSDLPAKGGLNPAQGVDLTYFVGDDGFARPMAQMPGEGLTWIHGLVVLRDAKKGERMFAAYMKVKAPLDVYQHGLAEFDDQSKSFRKVAAFESDAPVYPGGHPVVLRDGGTDYVYFCRPYPLVRVGASAESLAKLGDYEAYTCLMPGSRLERTQIDRGSDGKIRYGWKRNTPAVGPAEQAKLISDKHLKPDEALLQLHDRETGKAVSAHAGSVYWNEFRRRWVMITVEHFGTSLLGEIWYAEADSPLGPWVYAVKVVTHDRYSFYNPKQHPFFDERGGRTVYFEGTYTHTFSGNTDQTPRYDYNQIMYMLDLEDPKVAIPVAVYRQLDSILDRFAFRDAKKPSEAIAPDLDRIAFFALDRPGVNVVAVRESKTAAGHPCLEAGPAANGADTKPGFQFFAIPADVENPPAATPLYEYTDKSADRRAYSTNRELALPGFARREKPLCRVWRNPWNK